MIPFLLIIALIGTIILIFHLLLEINRIERKCNSLVDSIRKRYESKPVDEPNES